MVAQCQGSSPNANEALVESAYFFSKVELNVSTMGLRVCDVSTLRNRGSKRTGNFKFVVVSALAAIDLRTWLLTHAAITCATWMPVLQLGPIAKLS